MVKDLDEGTILGKSLYESNGKLLLGTGFRITDFMKKKLIARRYSHIYIMEEGTEDIVPEDIISEEIKLQAKNELSSKSSEIKRQSTFQNVSIKKAKKFLENGYLKNINITLGMHSMVDDILKDISSAGATFANMVMIKSEETYFLDHALNTSVLSILIGKRYGFSKDELKSLALGTFLHDIGKTVLEQIEGDDVLDKKGKLYNEHPTFGYLLLDRSSCKILPMETQIVNQHHENQDGTGFPIGLRGNNKPPIKNMNGNNKGCIYRLAEICNVVNAYDNLVYNPFKGKQLTQAQALKEIIKHSGTLYNSDIVRTLLKIIPHYPLGVTVKIKEASDPRLLGYTGVVAKINVKDINKPVIILIKDKYANKVKPIVMDTSHLKNIYLEVTF